MLYACVQKFDVTGNLKKFWELNRPSACSRSKQAMLDMFRLYIGRESLHKKPWGTLFIRKPHIVLLQISIG
jgi:hypothetical protein